MAMKIREAEQIVHDRLGQDWGVVKLSGWWLILAPYQRPHGDPLQSKSLDKAIRLALIDRDSEER